MKFRPFFQRRRIGRALRKTAASTPSDEFEFKYSEPLEKTHDIPPNSFTAMPCRLHLHDAVAVEAAKSLRSELAAVVNAPLTGEAPWGGSPIGYCTSLFFPECLPERMGWTTEFMESACFHDDWVEGSATGINYNSKILFALNTPTAILPDETSKEAAIATFVSRKALEFLEIYGKEGRLVLQRLRETWFGAMANPPQQKAKTFDSYVAHRQLDVGGGGFFALLGFSLQVSLSPSEIVLVQPLVDIAERILAKTNDYFSWEVERLAEDPFNAIVCLITEYGMTEEQAKEKLKASILEDEKTYLAMLQEFYQQHSDLPAHVRRFVAAGPLLVGGNHHWSAVCSRYNPSTPSTERSPAMAQEKPGHVTIIPAPIEEAVGPCPPIIEDPSQSLDNEVQLNNSALMGPVHYIQSLPSKNVRSKLIDAFNIWLQIPDSQLDVIKDAVSDLHNASLILDDIQDESGLRRGSAATHRIFGEAQSINSATYMILHAALRLYNEDVKTDRPLFRTFLTGLVHLTQGQSWDLQWKFNSHCPSAAEYMAMVDGKTGAMFDMLVGTMHALTTQPWELSIFSRLTQLLGRWFQIRDDYQNLQDPRYAEQKGFAEDLDEGKLSYPVIVCCNADATARAIILGILRAKQRDGKPLDHSVKLQLLGLIRSTEALSQTWTVVQQLQKEIEECLSNVERVTGIVNPQLHLVVKMLSDVAPP